MRIVIIISKAVPKKVLKLEISSYFCTVKIKIKCQETLLLQ
ncbi:hypothetical protein RAYM_04376 [Riemerella anatipestifer RA-YM]|nr:hypothetical protein RAYM_04376 [Riemerella anatipestifer RA-YM]